MLKKIKTSYKTSQLKMCNVCSITLKYIFVNTKKKKHITMMNKKNFFFSFVLFVSKKNYKE